MADALQCRLLIVDDDENVRNTLTGMLAPKRVDKTALDAAAAALFGPAAAPSAADHGSLSFQVDTAANGEQGLARVRAALDSGLPYVAAFVDMRMPGWDGLTTVERIREIDPQVEIILVTAYSDYSIREIVARAGMNVTYYCKPFAPKEIQQLARNAVYDWNQARFGEELSRISTALPATHESLPGLMDTIFQRVHQLLAAKGSAWVDIASGGAWQPLGSAGVAPDDARIARLLEATAVRGDSVTWSCVDDCLCFRVGSHAHCSVFDTPVGQPEPERVELVRLYLLHASRCMEQHAMRIKLAQTAQLAALGAGVAMVVHDLRNPIVGVRALVGQIIESEEFLPTVFADLQLIHSALRECEGTLDDLLEFVRGNKTRMGDHGPVNCRELVASTIAEAATWGACKGVKLVHCDCDPFTFHGARRKLRRALVNLILNAAEALHGQQAAGSAQITISCGRNAEGGWICVADNGPGLPPGPHEDLFEPFVTRDKPGGTGLGLAVVQRFVADHGARITVASDVSGSRFTIEGLPCQSEPS